MQALGPPQQTAGGLGVHCICEGQGAAEGSLQVLGTECVEQGLGLRLLMGHCGCQE